MSVALLRKYIMHVIKVAKSSYNPVDLYEKWGALRKRPMRTPASVPAIGMVMIQADKVSIPHEKRKKTVEK